MSKLCCPISIIRILKTNFLKNDPKLELIFRVVIFSVSVLAPPHHNVVQLGFYSTLLLIRDTVKPEFFFPSLKYYYRVKSTAICYSIPLYYLVTCVIENYEKWP